MGPSSFPAAWASVGDRIPDQPTASTALFPTMKTRVPECWAHGLDLPPTASERPGARGPVARSNGATYRALSPPGPQNPNVQDEASNLPCHQAGQGILRPVLMCRLQLLQWDSRLIQGPNLLPSPLHGSLSQEAWVLEEVAQVFSPDCGL